MAVDKGRGKKNQDLIDTRRLHPVGHDPLVHNVEMLIQSYALTGKTKITLACKDCPQRTVVHDGPIQDFHVLKPI